jgi:hypothetical protein
MAEDRSGMGIIDGPQIHDSEEAKKRVAGLVAADRRLCDVGLRRVSHRSLCAAYGHK